MKIRRYFTRFFARRSHDGQATFWADVVALGPGLNIRAVKQSDLDSVLPMMEKLSELHQNWDSVKYGFVEDVTSLYRNWLSECARNSRIVFLVTTINERVIAFVIGTVDQNPRVYRVPQYGFIRDLWVEEDYRKKSIGRHMLLSAMERFTQMGIKQIRLETAVPNEAARSFFTSCGFHSSAIEMIIER